MPHTILVVDDQSSIVTLVAAVLRRAGYTVLTAATGEEAIEVFRGHDAKIDLLLSNIQMPGITGIELGTKMVLERPDTKVMLMSGFNAGMLVLHDGWHFLPKPFMPGQLLSLVSLVLAKPSPPIANEHTD
jgi:DNA-binding NtrC family response regulator